MYAGFGLYVCAYSRDRQAGDIVAQLKAGIAMRAWVVRDGTEQEIEARELVPGDIASTFRATLTPFTHVLCRSYWKKDPQFPPTPRCVLCALSLHVVLT